MRRQTEYIALKGLNFVVGAALNFVLVYVLIRRLPIETYGAFVLISAMGVYVLATDLGITSLVYVRMRRAFLAGATASEGPFALAALGVYTTIALAAIFAFPLVENLFDLAPADMRSTFGLLFASVVLALPWGVVRVIANAADDYVAFEAAEAVRRLSLVIAASSMLLGLNLLTYALIALALWALGFGLMAMRLREVVGSKVPAPGTWLKLLGQDSKKVGAVSLFSALEFGIYNFPYLLVPAVYDRGWSLVAFDLFYKITRFGAAGYQAVNEALLPKATQAVHTGDASALKSQIRLSLGLSMAACLAGIVGVTVLGDWTFGILIGDAGRAPLLLRLAMAAMLVAMMIQACAGTLLLNTGKTMQLARTSICVGIAMALLAVGTLLLHWSFPTLLTLYVAIFATGALAYFRLLQGGLSRVGRGDPW